jgi:hypothetical protein
MSLDSIIVFSVVLLMGIASAIVIISFVAYKMKRKHAAVTVPPVKFIHNVHQYQTPQNHFTIHTN